MAAGRAVAGRLLDEGIEVAPGIIDPLRQAFADGLVDGLAEGLADPRGWVRNVLQGTGRLARNLNVEPEHGFVELIQNADDVGARCVRFAMSRSAREALVVHDGSRVLAPHVLAMTLALVSTKPDDADATGKFGIGLKTVTRLASSFEVHCAPYHFRVTDQQLARAPRRRSVGHFYDVSAPETLLSLQLRDGYPEDRLARWFDQFGAEGLLFMRSVRRLELRSRDGRLLGVQELKRSRTRTVQLRLDGKRHPAEELELRDSKSDTTWWRLSVRLPTPAQVERSDKATPISAPFAVAYSSRPGAGRLFAGLPLAVGGKLPFHLNALFDTDAPRSDLLQEDWNAWVVDRLTALCAAGAIHRLAAAPATGWNAVPLMGEVQGVVNAWLRARLEHLVRTVQRSVAEKGRLPDGDVTAHLREFSAEEMTLELLLTDDDVRALVDGPVVTRAARDEDSRWRAVLDEIEAVSWVSVDEALELLESKDLQRDGAWYVAMADLALDARLGPRLAALRCLLLDDGTRITPTTARNQGLLLGGASERRARLGEYLNLIRPLDPVFVAEGAAAERVRTWLRRDIGVRTEPGSDDVVEALARRSATEPLYLDDEALRLLREALLSVSRNRAPALAQRIGQRILVDGRAYSRGKWRETQVVPSSAYLPDTIDTGQDSWAKAGATTEGLLWVHRRYAQALSAPRARGHRERVDPEEARTRRAAAATERRGVQSFFRDLGAEVAPRLVPRRETDSRYGVTAAKVPHRRLLVDQKEALGANVQMTGLKDDRLSPDLDAVLSHIAKTKVEDGRPRARALLRSLSRAWGRLYAEHEIATVVNAYGTMQEVGTVPATWIAKAAVCTWMTNERGHKKAPRELAVRTVAFEAIFGDAPNLYADGLDTKDLDANAVRGFRFMREPRASNLLARLEELRATELRGRRIESNAVERCYRALSQAAPTGDVRRRRIDDMTLTDLKERFRSRVPGATGLVRTAEGWKSPNEVLVGRAIFQGRRSFVADVAPGLWSLLGMRYPGAADCARVLAEIAESEAPTTADTAVLIETYRYLARVSEGEQSALTGLRRIPLWTGRRWVSERPLYAVADPALQVDLGERIFVWRPPVRLRELAELLRPLAVTQLHEDTFVPLGINPGALAAGSVAQVRLRSAAAHLREWLAVNDSDLHDDLTTVQGLETARVAVNSKLHVEIPLLEGPSQIVPRRAHVQRTEDRLLFVFAKASFVDDSEIMGRLLGQLLSVDDRAQLVLAHGWLKALERVDADAALAGLTLPTTAPEAGDLPASPPGKSNVQQQTTAPDIPPAAPPPAPPPAPPRKLQKLDDIKVDMLRSDSTTDERPGEPVGDDKPEPPLQPPKPPGAPPKPPKPRAGPASWTAEERETLGLRLLMRELKRHHGLTLRDVRKQKNVGADAVDQHGRYYELKAHVGELPDSVGLEPSEFRRAMEQKENFVLAVVAGLEEGFKPEVRLVADPLRRLRWEPVVDIEVSGLLAADWKRDTPPTSD